MHPLKLWTIGHSTKTLEELIGLLQAHQIDMLVDVRSTPYSRMCPQFNREEFEASLRQAKIHYTHLAQLGGRRGAIKDVSPLLNAGWQQASFRHYADYALTKPFQEGLRELIELAKKRRVAIMCAEAVWWRCHRRIITDYLLARRVKVWHIMSTSAPVEASLTSFAQVTPERNVIYPEMAKD